MGGWLRFVALACAFRKTVFWDDTKAWRNKKEDSITRLCEHICGVKRKDGRRCKKCLGPVPIDIRQKLLDAYQDLPLKSGQHPAVSSQPEASSAGGQLVCAENPEATIPVAMPTPANRIGNSGAHRKQQTLDSVLLTAAQLGNSGATKRQKTLDSWKANMETEAINDDLADAFISAGSAPFRLLENLYFRKVLERIPGYTPIRRMALLARVDARETSWQKDKAEKLRDSVGTMVVASSAQGEGMLMRNFVFVIEPSGMPVHLFTRSVEAKNENVFQDAEAEARSMGARTLAFTIDNCSAELLALKGATSEGVCIPEFGCHFEVSELAMRDRQKINTLNPDADKRMAWVDKCFKEVEDVCTFFRTKPQVRAFMRRMYREVEFFKGPFKYLLGCRKNFGSKVEQAKRILEMEDALKYCVRHRQFKKRTSGDKNAELIRDRMLDPESDFWPCMHQVVQLYDPLYKFQCKYKKTSALACEVVRDWKMMEEETAANNTDAKYPVSPETLKCFLEILQARREKHQTINFRAAHLLNPVTMASFKAQQLRPEDRDALEKVAAERYVGQSSSVDEFMDEYCKLLEDLPGKRQLQRMKPVRWANLYANATTFPRVYPLLQSFLAAKGSLSVAEQGGSAVEVASGIHRKRLRTERSQRLVEGFCWFRNTRTSKAPDLLSGDEDSGNQTTNDEDMECDEVDPPGLDDVDVEESLGASKVVAQKIKEHPPAHVEAALTFEKDLCKIRDMFKSVDGQLLASHSAKAMFEELSNMVVSRETLRRTKVSLAVCPYKKNHPDMDTRLAASVLLGAWNKIYYDHSTDATCASQVKKSSAAKRGEAEGARCLQPVQKNS